MKKSISARGIRDSPDTFFLVEKQLVEEMLFKTTLTIILYILLMIALPEPVGYLVAKLQMMRWRSS